MSLVNLRSSLAGAALCAALLTAAPALAESLVVRASGPSAGGFSPGKKLADGQSITLKAGDTLTLLDGRGTRTLKGPGVFGTGASATGGAGSPRIASFLGTRDNRRARTGAVRSGTGSVQPKSPNLWYVDASQSANVCVPDASAVKLWRPVSADAMTVSISGSGGKAEIAFAAGESLVDWPVAEAPVTEGATYMLNGAGMTKPSAIKFTVLSPDAAGLESTASTLIERGCDAQLDLLIETVALPDPMG